MPSYLLLTAISCYPASKLRPLIHSWKTSFSDAPLHALVDGLTDETLAWLRMEGVILHPVPLPLVPRPRGAAKAVEKLLLRGGVAIADAMDRLLRLPDQRGLRRRLALLDVSAVRFEFYRRVLASLSDKPACVALLDARDSVFQAPLEPISGLHAFAESDSIGASGFAKRWLQMTYGGARWKQLRDLPFLCSGAIIGDHATMLRFLEIQSRECAATLALNGEDQAVFNHVIHGGLVAPTTIHAVGEGQIVHLNSRPLDSLSIRKGLMLNAEGKPFALVHQYDRVSGLADLLRRW